MYAKLSKHYATDLFACGKEAAEFCFGKDAEYFYVSNAIDPERFKFSNKSRLEIRNEYKIRDGDIIIGNIARFVAEKNHEFLVNTFSKIKDDRYKLLLIGDGPLQGMVKEQVARLGLKSRVLFLNATDTPEKYYSAMDMNILSSSSEGFPVSTLEAQCSGLPMILSDAVTREVKLTNDCFFLNLDDQEKWIKKILKIGEDRDTEDRIREQKIIEESAFNIYNSAERLSGKYTSMTREKIMFVVPTLVGGGAEKTVANLSKYLNKFFEVVIVVLDDTKQKYSYSGELIVLKTKIGTSKIAKITGRFRRARELRKLKAKYDIKCSVSFLLQADILNVLSKRKEKCIISIRNNDAVLFKKGVYRTLVKSCLKYCDHIVSISEQVRQNLIQAFGIEPDKITTIYNPCLITEFKNSSAEVDKQCFSKRFTFINVARLTDQKGQWHLIRAFKKVVDKYPDAKLIILGKGELEDYLKNLVRDLGLEKNISMLGFVDNPYDYLRKSDAFVFSSIFEGLGNSILEAMACGLPVISADCDYGPREILAPSKDYQKVEGKYEETQYGILCPGFDNEKYVASDLLTEQEAEYARAMIRLIEDKELVLKYRKMSEERVKYYDVDKIVNEWKEVINA